MNGAALLLPPALALLAAGTPRQADLLFRGRAGLPRRRIMRGAGFLLLALSLGMASADPDGPRRMVGWLGAAGLAALATALLITLIAAKRADNAGRHRR